ncbi:M48 family metallopeptidase [Psychrobacter sp. TAE2020]|uniref:M48 family metallopeptidase n=1 Tax=Psychrobacter sp. TAE2020 TaxID=2846762 RepID=UPI001C112BB7|nr:SprT family zinc-dependent metalloprotease [Psychrobacter sp. TAE2020]MBU5617274.1 M48 family metallopeptidase [Psychrobacter sp. TAE2020]
MVKSGVVYYGEEKIHYEVVHKAVKDQYKNDTLITGKSKPSKPSKSRKIVIKVHPDQRVVATAPIDATDAIIHDAMMKRARWIWQSLQDFAKQQDHVLPKRYVSGETQFYLGRRYVLKVLINVENNKVINSLVKLSRGKLNVEFSQSDAELEAEERANKVKSLIDQWYQDKAKNLFHARLKAMLTKASWVEEIPSFRLLAMKKQWGSCSTKGNLILNPHLVKAPKECIDYVILHELCHIAEHNHSEHFWRLLTQVMPNWKEVKARLDGMAELYLNE